MWWGLCDLSWIGILEASGGVCSGDCVLTSVLWMLTDLLLLAGLVLVVGLVLLVAGSDQLVDGVS